MSGVTTALFGLVTDSGPRCCEGDQFLCCRVIQVPKIHWEMVGTHLEHIGHPKISWVCFHPENSIWLMISYPAKHEWRCVHHLSLLCSG